MSVVGYVEAVHVPVEPVPARTCAVLPEADTHDRVRFSFWCWAFYKDRIFDEPAWRALAEKFYAPELRTCADLHAQPEERLAAAKKVVAAFPQAITLRVIQTLVQDVVWTYNAYFFEHIAEAIRSARPFTKPLTLKAKADVERLWSGMGTLVPGKRPRTPYAALRKATGLGEYHPEVRKGLRNFGTYQARHRSTFPRVIKRTVACNMHHGIVAMQMPAVEVSRLIVDATQMDADDPRETVSLYPIDLVSWPLFRSDKP